ncbi:hypothetical protein MBLNU459_g5075t1 [Dothideomycetes sp. NU459]
MTEEESDDGSQYTNPSDESSSENSRQDGSDSGEDSCVNTDRSRTNLPARNLEPGSVAPDTKARQARIVKLPGGYSDSYRDFYNSNVEDITNRFLHPVDGGLPGSQIGVTVWSSTEKEILFHKITTLGRDNIKGLASAIRSKSEAEIRDYILLLSDGAVEGTLTTELPAVAATEIPAACEISQECEAVLEAAADSLAEYQRKGEEKRETKWYGDYWLLTEDVAIEVEESLGAAAARDDFADDQDDDADAEEDDCVSRASMGRDRDDDSDLAVPAANLLHLPTWLKLAQLFMHRAPGTSEGWADMIADREEKPSIYHTAFQDFHNLAVSLTKRLVQASLFQSLSRLRARGNERRSPVVSAADVRTAAEILNMKFDRHHFWRYAARRHQLNVSARGEEVQRRYGASAARPKYAFMLTHDEVEAELGDNEPGDDAPNADADADADANADANIVSTVEDSFDATALYDDPDMWTDEPSPSPPETPIITAEPARSKASANEAEHAADPDSEGPRPRKHRSTQHPTALERQQDAYAEAFDRHTSALEERRLWAVLKLSPPADVKDEEAELLLLRPPPLPVYKRKARAELRDWRDTVGFEAEWEKDVGGLVGEAEFVAMHRRGVEGRKRRKLAREEVVADGYERFVGREDDDRIVEREDEESRLSSSQDEDMSDAGSLLRGDGSDEALETSDGPDVDTAGE